MDRPIHHFCPAKKQKLQQITAQVQGEINVQSPLRPRTIQVQSSESLQTRSVSGGYLRQRQRGLLRKLWIVFVIFSCPESSAHSETTCPPRGYSKL